MKRLVLILIFMSAAVSCVCTKGKDGSPGKPGATASLDGNWALEFIASASDFETLYPGDMPNASIDTSEKTIAGRNGCNSYSGNFTLDGTKFKTDPTSMISTKMFCEGDGEKTFMGALNKVESFSVTGDKLELKSGDEVVLRFHRK